MCSTRLNRRSVPPTLHLFSSVFGGAGAGVGGWGNETTVPYNGTFQGQLDKRVGSKLGGGGEEWQGEGVSKREPQSSCHVSGDLCPPSKSFPS